MAKDFSAVPALLFVAAVIATLACKGAALETCSHAVNQGEIVPRVPLGTAHRGRRETAQPIRFEVYFDNTVTSLQQEVKTLIQDTTVPSLLGFLQDTLAVKPASIVDKILLERSCTTSQAFIDPETDRRQCFDECAAETKCGTVTIPEDHLFQCIECGNTGNSNDCAADTSTSEGAGVLDKDYILYVSANQGFCSGGSGGTTTLAFAGMCQLEINLDRPIAGYVNFCPSAFNGNSDPDFVLSVTKHEVLHAIGFSRSLFPFWRLPDGMPRTDRLQNGLPFFNTTTSSYEWGDSTIRSDVLSWQTGTGVVSHNVDIMVTEQVVEEGRQHFGCPSLEGVELENQGGTATELSHWEKRILGNEAMTGVFTDNPGFSRMTLAALEDSGWYEVTYGIAAPLAWGKDAGCEFTGGSCGAYMDSQIASGARLNPFCNRVKDPSADLRRSCTADRAAVAICNLQEVPANTAGFTAEYQYFADASLGGILSVADFCPYRDVFVLNDGGVERGSGCSDPDNLRTTNNFAETYGPDSRCLEHGQSWTVTFPGQSTVITSDYGGGCYQYDCSSSGVAVMILGFILNCSCEGEELTFDLTVEEGPRYQGSILCPSCADICYDQLESCPLPPPTCYGNTTDQGPVTVQPPTMEVTPTPMEVTPSPTPSSAHYFFPYFTLVLTLLLVSAIGF